MNSNSGHPYSQSKNNFEMERNLPLESHESSPKVSNILLTMGSYYGTLAAARSFSREGYRVFLADHLSNTVTHFSLHLSQAFACPNFNQEEEFISWLEDFGQNYPDTFIYPSSDELAYLFAKHRERLSPHFLMCQPTVESVFGLLNKQNLYQEAQRLDIDVPQTFYPNADKDLDSIIANTELFPLLLKPKTQVGLNINLKGKICETKEDLKKEWLNFRKNYHYQEYLKSLYPNIDRPMLQSFLSAGATETYSLSGFYDDVTDICITRASQKVLQQPLKVGVGMAFESRPVIADLEQKIKKLCQRFSYFGAFEAEFIATQGRYFLIDFNPRFYGQMSFEIARQMPLPLLVKARAERDHEYIREVAEKNLKWDHDILKKFSFRFMMKTLLTTQWLGRQVNGSFRKKWLLWAKDPECIDPIQDVFDRRPYWAYLWNFLKSLVRHPRGSFRNLFL